MVKQLKIALLLGSVIVVVGCGSKDRDEKAFLNSPEIKPVSEAKSQQERGISPEVARGMAEPGLGGKR